MKTERELCSALAILLAVCLLVITSTQAYNDDRGFQKWSPYWFSNYRYSPPMSYYTAASTKQGGLPKRLGESKFKWSPRYLTEGTFDRPFSANYKITWDNGNEDGEIN